MRRSWTPPAYLVSMASAPAGTEALVRLLRVATVIDPRATVLSIDIIGAFHHVSRHAMLAGLRILRHRSSWQPLLPYVHQFFFLAGSALLPESR